MLKKKIKSMAIDKYFQIVKNEYVTIQLVPTKSNRNNSTDAIAALINKMFVELKRFIRIEDKKLIIQPQMKASYYIHITKEEVQFYFIIPKVHLMKFKSKFAETWKNIEVKEVPDIPIDINKCTKYQLKYKMNDALSLNVDKRNNELLSANMSVLEILESGESVGILYNFIPTSEKESNYQKVNYKSSIEKYKSGENLKKSKNIIDLGIITVKFLINFLNDLINSILNNSKQSSNVFISSEKEISNSTNRKAKSDICKTQVVVLSKSKEIEREKQLAISTCNTFKRIEDDNELIYKQVTTKLNEYTPRFYDVDVLNTTVEECSNFIAVPGKDIIETYKIIEHNAILESPVPDCLQNGEILIGSVKVKENTQTAYFSTHEQIQRAERVLVGPKGSGKTYKSMKLAINALNIGRGVVNIDIIEDCKLSKDIAKATPSDRLIRIDCSDINQIQAFVYNEIPINESMTPFQIVSNSIKRAQQLQLLFDSINTDASQLTPRMIKYLYAASAVVYSTKHNASLNDVLDCLSYPEKRHEYIEKLNDELKQILENRIKKLKELDKQEKSKVVNCDIKIDGILDRVSLLELSLETEVALSKTCDTNINFVEAIQDNKVILIELPEDVFTNQTLKNVMATFFLSKVWLAKKQLSKEQKNATELFFDEFYKCPNAARIFEEIFAEGRKYNLISTVTLHSVYELSNKCRGYLRSGGASYLLLFGCDIQNFKYLNEYFSNCGYEEDDLINLKEHQALCLIKNEEKNYSSFVATLPA